MSAFHYNKIYFSFLIYLLFQIAQPALSVSNEQETQEKTKKIVMMLNISAKEFQDGVLEGKVVIPAEYEECQIFLNQASERFLKISNQIKDKKESETLIQQFSELNESIKNKVDSQKVWDTVNNINSKLMSSFGIEINKSPITPVSLENGKKIFEKNCSTCHGLSGNGDGPMAKELDPRPAVLSDPKLTGDKNTIPYDNFEVINVGIANTTMKAWADILSEAQIWDVTYYIRTFSNEVVQLPPVKKEMMAMEDDANSETGDQVIGEVIMLLEESMVKFKEGNNEKAAEIAFDAYLVYEKIESNISNKDKSLSVKLESNFSRYRGEIKQKAPLKKVEELQKEVLLDLSKALKLLKSDVGFKGLFLQSFSIIVREGFEAILIIAALIAFLKKSRNDARVKNIHIGVIVGILASFLTAYIIHEVLHINMASQELLEGWIMLVTVVILFWVSYWLISNIDNKQWQKYINQKMSSALSQGNTFTLSAAAFISVYREGFETVLFYKALFLYAGESNEGIIPGFLAGCAVLALVFYLINHLGMRIPIKWFFGFTSALLYYMAFIFMGRGIHELQMGEQLPITPVGFLPKISWLGMYPTWETFIGQSILLAAFVFGVFYTFIFKSVQSPKN